MRRLPHPLVLLLGGVAVAACLTWILPAGAFDRHEDPATGRVIVAAGTYHRVPASPVGPFAAAVAVPKGFIDAADVIALVLFVGGAWIVLDRLGALGRIVSTLAARIGGRRAVAIPIVSAFFVTMGALENMQEEIIALVPVLLLLGRAVGVDAVTVVAMSAGAAMIGSAFGPTNPFQAGIAMKLAGIPPMAGAAVRTGMLVAASVIWVAWTLRHAARSQVEKGAADLPDANLATSRDVAMFALMLTPMAVYVYGAMAWNWGLNELSAGFLVSAIATGLVGGLGVGGVIAAYLDGMQQLLPAALLIGVARAISSVLTEGHVIDTILVGLSQPLGHVPAGAAALLMIPFHAVIHVVVPSVSGHAALTMPIVAPLSDLLGIPRQVTVAAYQTGAGLTEMLTPTNGALMAILLAGGVSYPRWIRFAAGGAILAGLVGIAGMLALSVLRS